MRRALIVGAGALLVSCSALVSFDGLVDGTALDASNAADVNARDAEVDSLAVDATASDAGIDAPFCVLNPGHALCDDFDEQPLAVNWTMSKTNGTVGLDDTTFTSPPNSAKAFSPLTPDGGDPDQNSISHVFSSAATITFLADVKVAGASTACDFLYVTFNANPSTQYASCYIDISQKRPVTVLEVYCGGGSATAFYQSMNIDTVPSGWARYSLSIDLNNAIVQGRIEDGGVTTISMPSGFSARGYTVSAGPNADTTSGACTVNVDDVIVDTK